MRGRAYLKNETAGLADKLSVRYYRHPKTGVVVEVDGSGMCSLVPFVGNFRPFREITDTGKIGVGKRITTYQEETKRLLRHGWIDIS
jgi:hypothetical protein